MSLAGVLVLALSGVCPAADSPATPLPKAKLEPFFQEYCIHCHGPEKQKGDMRFDQAAWEIGDSATAELWQEVLNALNLGEMPPEDEPQPTNAELERVLEHLTSSMEVAKRRLSESGGDVALRRINRREYRNTIQDLMGLGVPDELLPDDDIGSGYDTVGQDQQFSSYHFDGYFQAAKTIVETALDWVDRPRADPEIKITEVEDRLDSVKKYIETYDATMERIEAGATFEELGFDDEKQKQMYIARHPKRTGQRRDYLDQPRTGDGAYLDSETVKTGVSHVENADPRASYNFRIVGGLNGERPLIRQFVEVKVNDRTVQHLKINGTVENPGTVEFLYRPLLDQTRCGFKVQENRVSSLKIDPYVKKVDPGGPKGAIWIDRLESEGPYYPDQPSDFEQLYSKYFGTDARGAKVRKRDIPNRRENAKTTATTAGGDDEERKAEDQQAKRFLEAFAFRAFRNRVPSPEFIGKVYGIYLLHRNHDRTIKEALTTPLAMILSAPSFLYLMEETPENESRHISQTEFANRLSHFLWSRSPDRELVSAANAGKLYEPSVLTGQVARMLRHRHRWALSEGFFSQWAELDRFNDIAIDQNEHVRFNDGVRRSAGLEPQHFFDTLIEENLGIDQLIDSDLIVIDELLAAHYGIRVRGDGSGFQNVLIAQDSPRGGLLGQTAFLTMGSNGERSSPIIRGALIMDKFLHNPPPPPPPNVPELAVASSKPLAVMEIVELHRGKAQCASCHRGFDPLGFGLENFDLLGQWRDLEKLGNIGKRAGRQSETIPVRAQGVFPDRTEFTNLEEFREGLLQQKHLLTRSIAEGLLSYALGRHLEYSDEQALDEICAITERNGGKLGDLIQTIARHEVFRRGDQRR